MKILQICNKAPFPIRDGHTVGMNAISQGLNDAGVNVKILSMNTIRHHIDISKLPKKYIDDFKPVYIDIDTRIKPIDAFINLFKNESYNIIRFYSENFERELSRLLEEEEFDIIFLESIILVLYINTIRKKSKAKVIIREHNVESQIWYRRATEEKNFIKKLYLNLLARRLDKFERYALSIVDGIATVTDIDKKSLINIGCRTPIMTIQNGLNFDNIPSPREPDDFPSLFFIGSMEWSPNLDGLIWFINDIWKNISFKYPDLKFYIAGRNIHNYEKFLKGQNIIIVGEVENAYDFMQSKAIMIVPILYGSGNRVKIVEAMSLGKAIISTSLGSEGIAVKDKYNILIADTLQEFINTIDKYVFDKELYNQIGMNALNFAQCHFDNKIITNELIKFFNSLM